MITKEQIEQNLGVIKLTIENFNGLDTYAIIEYLGEITALQALATETQAAAKFHLLCAIDAELDRQARLNGNDKVAPSIKKMRADAKCKAVALFGMNYVHDIRVISAILLMR
jgi:hypothetical protein